MSLAGAAEADSAAGPALAETDSKAATGRFLLLPQCRCTGRLA